MQLTFRTCLALAVMVIQPIASRAAQPTRLMVDLSEKPDPVLLSAFDLCILDSNARINLEAQQTLGSTLLARVDLFEVAAGSEAEKVARSVDVPVLEGSKKGRLRLDATHPNWVAVVVREIAQSAAERGFDGFVLTGLDTISLDAERAACLRALTALDAAYPDKEIVIEGGLDLVSEGRRNLDGVLFLDNATTEAETRHRNQRIREVKRQGLRPLVVEFAPTSVSSTDISEHTAQLRGLGAVPFFTTPELRGIHLGPLQEVTRRILVLHSGDARQSFTAQILQGSLEWLGYQVRYVDAGISAAPTWENELARVSGVILDASLQAQPQQQGAFLALTDYLVAEKVPLFITGAPWGTREEFAAWSQRLGLRGTGQSLPIQKQASLHLIEQTWLQESGAVRPRSSGFRDLQAPASAQVLVSVKADDTRFDSVFLANWGGLWLDPLAVQAGPQLQPLKVMEAWLKNRPTAPVPDIASQGGRRLLVPQVSSEGFTATTSLQGMPIAAEAMTERILSRYSLPFTVAVCEGDLKGTNPGLDSRDSLRYETAARALFSLPQVHAASATRTRPTAWENVAEMQQEIAGSMNYIHRQLLPTGRHVELMLWPQASAPSAAAVTFSLRMGVENAQPVTPALLPGRTPPPAASTWGQANTHQALTPSPRLPGPLNAHAIIHAAENQNSGRWVAPLHIPLSFHDVSSETGLWEVERLLDWCVSQPLHAMSLPDHARLVRDAAQTRLFQQGEHHWIIVNAGHARTLRLPASLGVPDLDRSIGIAGYNVRGEDLYIHTLGRRRTELILTPNGSPAHLRLAGSSGSVRYLEAGNQRALLQVADLRPVEIAFAGIQPGAICQIFTTEQPQFLMADPEGRIQLTVPAQTTLQLQVLPTQQAVMR